MLMQKYAYSPEVMENKSANWILQPWIKCGAKMFNSVDEIPENYTLISVHHPPWRSPYKEWIESGRKHIEIDYGYWGINNPRRNTRRVTYGGSHNLQMNQIPYSRIHTLIPKVEDWKKTRGSYLLLIEPQQEIVKERLGIDLATWKNNLLDKLKLYWEGPVKWRRKAGGKNPGRWPSFLEDLKGCHAVVGERTMACVEAVMLGYPAFTTDFSTVSLLMGTDLNKINNIEYPDRTQWLEHVSWSQFYPDEFSQETSVSEMVERYQIRNSYDT